MVITFEIAAILDYIGLIDICQAVGSNFMDQLVCIHDSGSFNQGKDIPVI
jgi:hypothetical protein